nr:hypothetical protein GCM10025699_46340 [Microbacterium flavescens]
MRDRPEAGGQQGLDDHAILLAGASGDEQREVVATAARLGERLDQDVDALVGADLTEEEDGRLAVRDADRATSVRAVHPGVVEAVVAAVLDELDLGGVDGRHVGDLVESRRREDVHDVGPVGQEPHQRALGLGMRQLVRQLVVDRPEEAHPALLRRRHRPFEPVEPCSRLGLVGGRLEQHARPVEVEDVAGSAEVDRLEELVVIALPVDDEAVGRDGEVGHVEVRVLLPEREDDGDRAGFVRAVHRSSVPVGRRHAETIGRSRSTRYGASVLLKVAVMWCWSR